MSMSIKVKVFDAEQLELVRQALRNAVTANVQFIESFCAKSHKEADRNRVAIDRAEARIKAVLVMLDQLPGSYRDGETYPKGKR